MKISVVIRSKNQQEALAFLLHNLTTRYADDIDEVIVLDNCSKDESEAVSKAHGARFVTIEKFSYGGSANIAAQVAKNEIIVIFSAHAYPVSHDFFKMIQQGFNANSNLAGLRCLHSTNDFSAYIKGIKSKEAPNRAGLIFSGSAFRKSVWELHKFREDVATFEDKEWSKRVLTKGYDIDFVPAIFHYNIQRTKKQLYFRFKNDVIGNYQLWHEEVKISAAIKGFFVTIAKIVSSALKDLWYAFKRVLFILKFNVNKPDKF